MDRLLYPIGIQTFSEIIEKGFVYVDKTEYIHKLVSTSKYIFLSRPRRFGKSLLLSTIEAYFEGRQELFEGLAINEYEHDWEQYPVLHIDFSGSDYNNVEGFTSKINYIFQKWEQKYNLTPDSNASFGVRFGAIIEAAHTQTGKQAVILIDEYDKPLLETVDNEPLQEQFRNTLRGIYGNLKGQDAHISFAILTGVTRFGHLSIFSDLNNLQDISMDERYAGICGITTEELKKYFTAGIEHFAQKEGVSTQDILDELKRNYDGYHFSPINSPDIYNPFSLLNSLNTCSFSDYWFRTGTPTFLLKLVKAGKIDLQRLNHYEAEIRSLSDVSFNLSNYISVLYQSGYLTIKGYEKEFQTVDLDFPNMEVERGFFYSLLEIYAPSKENETAFSIKSFVLDVRKGRAEDFMQRLQSFFSDFQYDAFDLKNLERHYQDVVFILMKLMGFYTDVEYKTASGRIDMVIRTSGYVYVFEFKIDKSAQDAIAQIDSKDYLLPFKADGRTVIKIGADFSTTTRTLEDWIISECEK